MTREDDADAEASCWVKEPIAVLQRRHLIKIQAKQSSPQSMEYIFFHTAFNRVAEDMNDMINDLTRS